MPDQPTAPQAPPLYKTPEIRAALDAFVRAVYAWGHYSREIHNRCADALELLGRGGAATVLRDFADDGGLDAVASDPDVLACVERLDRGEPLTDDAYRRLEGDLGLYVERTQAMVAALAQLAVGAAPARVPEPEPGSSAPHPSGSGTGSGMFGGPPPEPDGRTLQTPTTKTTEGTDGASDGTIRA